MSITTGDGWHTSPTVTLQITPPHETEFAPITGARYKLCRADDRAVCTFPTTVGGLSGTADVLNLPDVSVPSEGQWVAYVALMDSAGNVDLSEDDNDDAHVRYDNRAPDVSIAPLDPSDPGTLGARATDDLSGVSDGQVELAPHGTDKWRALPTTVGRGAIAAQADDTALPNGSYDERVVATDAAGNVGMAVKPGAIAVPFRFATRMHAGFVVKHTVRRKHRRVTKVRVVASRRVRYHRRAMLRGSLLTQDGQPPANARVVVTALAAATGAQPEVVGDVTTDKDGRFSYTTIARESRQLTFAYEGTATRQPARAAASLAVAAATSIHISRRSLLNGDTAVFRGRLKGGHLPPGGKLVALQAWVRGVWQPIANVRTDPRGSWHASHTFTTVADRASFRFRLEIPHDALYPFAAGSSRPVDVVVRGL